MGFRYFVVLVVFTGLVGLMGCAATTQPTQSLTCEQQFDRALERGVSYTDALGNYTQCLLNRGDTITQVTGR